MHTQTERLRTDPATAPSGAATGLALYALTLAGEAILGASLRWLVTYLGAATVGAIVPLGLSAEPLAWLAALLPLLWSALAVPAGGAGWMWRRRLGARRPAAEEVAAIEQALALLRSEAPDPAAPGSVFVLDDPYPQAATRGGALVLSSGLIDSEGLAPVLAHELGHLGSLDARLTEALARLSPGAERLAPASAAARPGEADEPREGALLLASIRGTARLAMGGAALRLLAPLWAAHWRRREYAADAFAASLGQGEDLARHLADMELPFDVPQRRLFFNRAEHPPVAHRIERLQAATLGEGTE